jgi:GNAT superfamily N-acetyltransferase
MTTIRPILDTDHSAILDLATDLSEWFDADARTRAIPIDLHHQQGFVAEEGGYIVGFITLFVAEGRLNIGWFGVSKDCQRKGVGGRLLDAAEETVRDMSLCELATYTLGDSVDYVPYEQTRAFYFKHGFRIYQRSKTNNPSCPEEIKIAKRIAQQMR